MSLLFRYPINLFLIIPFAQWMGALFTGLYLFFITFYALLRRLVYKDLNLSPLAFSAILFSIFYVIISFLLHDVTLEKLMRFGPSDFLPQLLLAIQFFVLLFIINIQGTISKQAFTLYVKYLFVVSILSILLESFGTNILHIPINFFPGYIDSYAYTSSVIGNYHRPFGLTCSAPMNGSILVALLWLYIGLGGKKGRDALKLHSITFITLLVNFSGQALITYFAILIIYQLKWKLKGMILVVLLLIMSHFIMLYSLLSWKLSYDYLFRQEGYLYFNETIELLTPTQILFGGLDEAPTFTDDYNGEEIETEFYPLYSISHFGIILSLFFWCSIFFQKTNRTIKMALYASLIGSLHYGSLLRILLQVPLAILLIHKKRMNLEHHGS